MLYYILLEPPSAAAKRVDMDATIMLDLNLMLRAAAAPLSAPLKATDCFEGTKCMQCPFCSSSMVE